MIYVSSYALLALTALITLSRQWASVKIVGTVVVAFFAFLAIARGDVGTDTNVYERLVRTYIEWRIWIGIEPGFIAYVRIANLVSNNEILITRGLSAIFFFFILMGFTFMTNCNVVYDKRE